MAKKSKPKPVDDSVELKWVVGYSGYQLLSYGMAEKDDPDFLGTIITNRTTEIAPTANDFRIITRFSVSRQHTEDDSHEPYRVLWAAVEHTFAVSRVAGANSVSVTMATAETVGMPALMILNLINVAHASMRGVADMIVRGTWLEDFVLHPAHIGELIPENAREHLKDHDIMTLMV